jgi:hypothetical protein
MQTACQTQRLSVTGTFILTKRSPLGSAGSECRKTLRKTAQCRKIMSCLLYVEQSRHIIDLIEQTTALKKITISSAELCVSLDPIKMWQFYHNLNRIPQVIRSGQLDR